MDFFKAIIAYLYINLLVSWWLWIGGGLWVLISSWKNRNDPKIGAEREQVGWIVGIVMLLIGLALLYHAMK